MYVCTPLVPLVSAIIILYVPPSSPLVPLVSAIIILYHRESFSKLVMERIFLSSLSYPTFPLPCTPPSPSLVPPPLPSSFLVSARLCYYYILSPRVFFEARD